MAVEAEKNMCFDNVGGFGSCTIPTPQGYCLMGSSGFGIQDGLGFFPRMQILQPGSLDNLPATASSSSSSSSYCGSLPLDVMQSLSCELERQRMEMDWFLQMENQRMRSCVLLEEARQREIIIQKYESRMKTLILHEDQQLVAAKNRARELKNSLEAAEIEAKAWQKKATEKEAAFSYLKNKLNRAYHQRLETVSSSDSSSSCSEEEQQRTMACKVCKTGRVCCVFFPCRHLCCCNQCEAVLGHCPVCGTVKEASLEVFLDMISRAVKTAAAAQKAGSIESKQ